MKNRIKTNIIFFHQDLDNGYECFDAEKFVEKRYETTLWLCDYNLNERKQMAKTGRKKFGFVLKSLK